MERFGKLIQVPELVTGQLHVSWAFPSVSNFIALEGILVTQLTFFFFPIEREFPYHKFHPSNMYVFKCIHDLVLARFHHPQRKPMPVAILSPFSLIKSPVTTNLILYLPVCLFWTFCVNGSISYVVCDQLPPLNTVFSRFMG